jgi:hypothetical protein
MQACLENAPLSFVESTSLPLLESAPAWTIRVARPTAVDRNDLARELRGVPKAALRQVFGKILGTHLWQQHRAAIPVGTTTSPTGCAVPPIPDAEIRSGMLRYLCAEAATTLRERKRVAKSLSLTVLYSDGESETVREPLHGVANDSAALETAARLALRRSRSDAFVSLKLDLTATPIQA